MRQGFRPRARSEQGRERYSVSQNRERQSEMMGMNERIAQKLANPEGEQSKAPGMPRRRFRNPDFSPSAPPPSPVPTPAAVRMQPGGSYEPPARTVQARESYGVSGNRDRQARLMQMQARIASQTGQQPENPRAPRVSGPQPAPQPAPQPRPAPQPAPRPSPAPQPAPQPRPNPTPQPAPSPAPQPAPQPAPRPAPQPSPASPPAPQPSPPLQTPQQPVGNNTQPQWNMRPISPGPTYTPPPQAGPPMMPQSPAPNPLSMQGSLYPNNQMGRMPMDYGIEPAALGYANFANPVRTGSNTWAPTNPGFMANTAGREAERPDWSGWDSVAKGSPDTVDTIEQSPFKARRPITRDPQEWGGFDQQAPGPMDIVRRLTRG